MHLIEENKKKFDIYCEFLIEENEKCDVYEGNCNGF